MPSYSYTIKTSTLTVRRRSWKAVSLFIREHGINLVAMPYIFRKQKTGAFTRNDITIDRVLLKNTSDNMRLFLPVQLNIREAAKRHTNDRL